MNHANCFEATAPPPTAPPSSEALSEALSEAVTQAPGKALDAAEPEGAHAHDRV